MDEKTYVAPLEANDIDNGSGTCTEKVVSSVPVDKSGEDSSVTNNPDPYLYTKLEGFTSEIFKIEIGNLPNYFGYSQLRKLLNDKLKLGSHKVKVLGAGERFAFVTFKNEQSRDKALQMLNGYLWKGKTLTAKKAKPLEDPMAKKRRAGDSEDVSPKISKVEDENSIALMLKNAVTPLWQMTYEEQLETKEKCVHDFLVKLARQLERANNSQQFRSVLRENRRNNQSQCCPMEPVKPSPSISGYRNKCEFSVGNDLLTKQRTVGFRLSQYKKGSMSVAAPDDCINTSSRMLKAVKSFEAYVRQSDKDVYNPETHSGYWRQLTVRTSSKDILLIIVMHPQQLSKDDLDKEMMSLKTYFETGDGSLCGATSVYFQPFSKMQSNLEDPTSLIHLSGKENMEENLLDMTFQISPEAFFQINSGAAEVLYKTIAEKIGSTSLSTVLDICCGTGTIGLFLAKHGAKVIGIEMCQQAVDNARANAEANDINSVEFICGKAEDVISSVIYKNGASDMVAIANPPRAGLYPKVIKILRATETIKKLVYVSCSPNSAIQNFVDLCRSTSNNYKGKPFYPVQATAIDMFPHTPHYELVLVFERQS